jgi:hypothetical protein
MGTNSAYQLTSGSQNIGIGTNAGQVLTTGSNNMFFGHDVKALTSNESNTIRFGNATQITGIIMPAPSSNISIGGTGSTITIPQIKLSGLSASNHLYLDSTNTVTTTSIPTQTTYSITSSNLVVTSATVSNTTTYTLSTPQNLSITSDVVFNKITVSNLTPSRLVKTGVDGDLVTASTINLVDEISGILPIAAGGTASSSVLTNNKIMVSVGNKIIEGPALTNGQLLIGRTGSLATAGNITGTASQIIVTNGSGTIGLSLPQNINTSATPIFSSVILGDIPISNYIKTNASNMLTGQATIPIADINATGLTTNRFLYYDGSSITTSTTSAIQTYSVTGTANQVSVSTSTVGTNTTFTFSLPTDITVTNMLVNNLTPSTYLKSSGAKYIISGSPTIPLNDLNTTPLIASTYLALDSNKNIISTTAPTGSVTSITATANQTTVTNTGTTYTVGTVQSIGTGSAPTFKRINTMVLAPDTTNNSGKNFITLPCPEYPDNNTLTGGVVMDTATEAQVPNNSLIFYFNTTSNELCAKRKNSSGVWSNTMLIY